MCWKIIFLIVCYILKTLGELRKMQKNNQPTKKPREGGKNKYDADL